MRRMLLSRERRQGLGIVVLLGVALGAIVVRSSLLTSLVLPGLLGTLSLLGSVHFFTGWFDDPKATQRVLRWTMAAFVIHLACGLIITNVAAARGYLGPDSLGYHAGAVEILRHWQLGFPMPELPHGKEGFFYTLAALYWVLGAQTTAGIVLNATLGAALVPLISDSAHRLGDRRAADKVPPLVVLLPGLILWPSQLLREAAILFLLALASNFAVRICQRVSPARLLGFTMALAVLFTFRGYIALVASGALLLGIAFGKQQLLTGVGTAAGAVAIVAVLVLSLGLGYAGYQAAANSNFQDVNTVRQGLSVSVASGFGSEVDVSTRAAAFSYLPVGLFNFFLGPFPWQIRGVRQLPALPDVFIWWCLLPAMWRGYRTARRQSRRRILVLMLPGVAIASVLGLILGNYGILVRERTQVVVVMLPIIAIGLAQKKGEGEVAEAGSEEVDRPDPELHDAVPPTHQLTTAAAAPARPAGRIG